jgi:hypothetical protein
MYETPGNYFELVTHHAQAQLIGIVGPSQQENRATAEIGTAKERLPLTTVPETSLEKITHSQ